MDKETVCTILADTLGMQKVCTKMVPRLLTEEQQVQRLNSCQDIHQQLEADDKLLKNVITGDESWVFQHDQKQNDKVASGKVRPHPDQKRPASNVRKGK